MSRARFAPVVVVGLLLSASVHGQTTWLVDASNCPGPGDGSVGNPFCLIQDGIDAAASGFDEAVVAPGTYDEIIDFNGKAITVRSSSGAAVTSIDAKLVICDRLISEVLDATLDHDESAKIQAPGGQHQASEPTGTAKDSGADADKTTTSASTGKRQQSVRAKAQL